MNWQTSIESTLKSIQEIEQTIADLNQYRDRATADIAKYLRMDSKGIELDIEAIQATLTRPYTLLPINEHEAWLIHWRGVRMPIFGWVVAQEPAFIKAKVTRSMDLLTPLPTWMKQELGWKPPAHKAVIDGTHTSLKLTEGDGDTFRKRYGHHLGNKQEDGTYKIKGGDAWIRLVAALVRDGILPYVPTPVHHDHWDAEAKLPKLLNEIIEKKQTEAGDKYIERAAYEFLTKGAVLVNYPPGAGKTLTTCAILNHFRGRVLLLADSTVLVEQWHDRLKLFSPDAKVTVSTYQGAGKHLDKEWDLLIADEAQRLPANTFSKLAFIKTKYRLGLTGTPWREDDRQHLIVALSGFPVAIRWAELIASGALRRPRIIVATVQNEAAKTSYVRSLLAKHKGRALIFCDWLEQGQALADVLHVPFVHGGTSRKLDMIEDSEVCVVSRVGDRGLDLPDLRLVIEVAGAGSAREQFAQRVGRLLHGTFAGEFITVFTPEEAAKYRGRVFGVEAELAGEVDIEFVEIGKVTDQSPVVSRQRSVVGRKQMLTKASIRTGIPSPTVVIKQPDQPMDEIAQALSLPAVAAKVNQAKKSVGGRTAPYVNRVIRYCWATALSPKEIAEGLGVLDAATKSRMNSACNALVKAGLMVSDENGRFRINQEEIQRLKTLSQLRSQS